MLYSHEENKIISKKLKLRLSNQKHCCNFAKVTLWSRVFPVSPELIRTVMIQAKAVLELIYIITTSH